MSALLDRSRVGIKLGEYGTAPATALSDPAVWSRTQEYRRQTAARTVPLESQEIGQRIAKAEYFVSRKIDGEFTVLAFQAGECLSVNPGGTVRVGLPWQAEAARALDRAGIRSALIAGELYVHLDDRRSRVHDVTSLVRQPRTPDDLNRIGFAVFDVLALDDQRVEQPYARTWRWIEKVFGRGSLVHPVDTRVLSTGDEVRQLFAEWVEKEGSEGLVVRSDTAGLFKIKPRHNLDAVVIGFTEAIDDRRGLLHDLLVAVMRQDDTFQVLTRVGGGLDEEDRRNLLSDLKDMVVDSAYAEVNADHVAYQMVKPDWVVEISCLDLISETTRGGPVNRMVLNFTGNGHPRYEPVRRLPLAAVISPQFVRLREDKSVRQPEVRIEQVSQRVEVPLVDRDARQLTLASSQLLERHVYVKPAKGETMVRKFVAWRTNKERDSDEYPAYVLHYTDFSPNRKDPLEREVRVSSSRDQLHALLRELIAENVKKGWSLHSSMSVDPPVPAASAPAEVIQAAGSPPPVPSAPVDEAPAPPAAAAEPPATPRLAPSKPTRSREPRKKKKPG